MPPKKGFIPRDYKKEWLNYINICAINQFKVVGEKWTRNTGLFNYDDFKEPPDSVILNIETKTIIYRMRQNEDRADILDFFKIEIDRNPTQDCYTMYLDFDRRHIRPVDYFKNEEKELYVYLQNKGGRYLYLYHCSINQPTSNIYCVLQFTEIIT